MSLLSFDGPIDGSSPTADLFGHGAVARAVERSLAASDPHDSGVIAITGSWGSGKSSTLNQLRDLLNEAAGVVVVEVNPWLLIDTGGLASAFFAEVARNLSTAAKAADAVRALLNYAARFSKLATLVGIPGVEGVVGALRDANEPPTVSVRHQREAVAEAIRRLEIRIVVLVDDIDRLDASEAQEVLRLMRLAGGIPGITYVAAVDPSGLTAALGTSGMEPAYAYGYLEKIVQASWPLPQPTEESLTQLLHQQLSSRVPYVTARLKALGDARRQLLDGALLRSLRTPRDLVRLVNHVATLPEELFEEIDVRDLVLIEALRSKVPEIWALLSEDDGQLSVGLESDDLSYAVKSRGDAIIQRQEALGRLVERVGVQRWGIAEPLLMGLFPDYPRTNHDFRSGAVAESSPSSRFGLLRQPSLFRYYTRRVFVDSQLRPSERRKLLELIAAGGDVGAAVADMEPHSRVAALRELTVHLMNDEDELARLTTSLMGRISDRWDVDSRTGVGRLVGAWIRRVEALGGEATIPGDWWAVDTSCIGAVVDVLTAAARSLSAERSGKSPEVSDAIAGSAAAWLRRADASDLTAVGRIEDLLRLIGDRPESAKVVRSLRNDDVMLRRYVESLWSEHPPYGWTRAGGGEMVYSALPGSVLKRRIGEDWRERLGAATQAGLAPQMFDEAVRSIEAVE